MNKNIAALALALTLVGTLASCSNRDPNTNNGGGSAGNQYGSASGTTGSTGTSGTAGQVSRRYGGAPAYNGYNDYFDDGRYVAGTNGQVYGGDGSAVSRDLTRDARDIVRDTGDALGDVGRSIGDMVTGNDNGMASSGTPSWQTGSGTAQQ